MPTLTELQDNLRTGLATISEQWNYKAKDWVTSVYAADIDDDGDIEIIVGSRDGRVHTLTREGDVRWRRIVGNKAWIGTLTSVAPPGRSNSGARIVVGTRDGYLYAFDKDGKTVSKTGRVYAYEKESRPSEAETAAFWYNTEHIIRQVYAPPEQTKEIVFGSEDRCVYALDSHTGTLHWKFQTGGRVRAVFACDIDGDGKVETLVGSGDNFLYVLDSQGQCIDKKNIQQQIHTIFAGDIDQDGCIEILISTDGKDLSALEPGTLTPKWCRTFDSRLLSLCVTDIDNDGHNEIIVSSEDKHLSFLDSQGKVLWRHTLGYRVFSLHARDIDNDGIGEVIAGSEDTRVHVFRVNLIKGLDKKIRRGYQALGKPPLSDLTDLSLSERVMLKDILGEAVQAETKLVSLKQVENSIEARDYLQALSLALKLEQQQVQVLWRKDEVGHVRTLCVGDIYGDAKLEIIVGTDRGDLQAFTSFGRLLWSLNLGYQILATQTGYLNRGKWANVVVCSTDHCIHVLNEHTQANSTKPLKMTQQTENTYYIDEWMSSICVNAPGRYESSEVVVGSEDKKIYIYKDHLESPLTAIPTPQGIKILCTHTPEKDDTPEIVAGSLGNHVYAYTRAGTPLWTYETHDRVQDVCMRDLDSDGNGEVIVGSEDRNIHVLDYKGHLKWRYFLPDRILAVEAADIDGDKKMEILAGCGDGYLYVFNREGDLLWKYKSNDRIRVVRVEDINEDKHAEIVLGSEDRLNVLQAMNQHQLHEIIHQCWLGLQQKRPAHLLIEELLHHPDPALRAFILNKYIEQTTFTEQECLRIEECAKKESIAQVRKALIRPLMSRYPLNPQQARLFLDQLLMDPEQEVKLAFLEHLPLLMRHDAKLGFEYLHRFSRNLDRFVRRAVVRTLHHLIGAPYEKSAGKIFDLLLMHVLDKESSWIQQEAGRTLAHFLDTYYADLVMYTYVLIARGVAQDILHHIASHATIPYIQNVFRDIVPLMYGVDETNVHERLAQAVKVLEETRSLRHGEETWSMYHELQRLFNIRTIDEIAQYQCTLEQPVSSTNKPFSIALRIFTQLSTITRKLRIYLLRQSVDDRLAGLLEANHAIEEMHKFVEREYTAQILGEVIHRLPDHLLFTLLLKRWQNIVLAQLSELRGKAALKAELKTRHAWHDEQVGVVLVVSNTGRSTANNVKVTLLHSSEFDIVGAQSLELESILAQEEVTLEFIIEPHSSSPNLVFEIAYSDVGPSMMLELFGDRVELQVSQQAFEHIPNPYSTGTPTHDSSMFYGREKDIAFLKDNLTRTSAKTVIVLYGQRRSGKTTLLHHLVRTTILDEHIPVLIDMQRFAYQISASKFFHNLAFHIYREMKKKGITLDQPAAQDFESDPTFAFDLFLDDVESHLQGQRVILLIDEFEVLEDLVLKKKLEPEVFGYIRSLMQHRPYLNFLLSGTHQIEQLIKGYWSVFFNIALHYQLGKLSKQAAKDLITKPVAPALEYEPHAVQKIRHLTADQPYLIHLICRSLVDHCNERRKGHVTINDVNVVLHEVMQTGQFHFSWIWDSIQPEERLALSIIAHASKDERQRLSLIEIEEIYQQYHIPYKRERIVAILKSLIDADIIETPSDTLQDTHSHTDTVRYRIPVGLIRQWLRKEKPIELAIREVM